MLLRRLHRFYFAAAMNRWTLTFDDPNLEALFRTEVASAAVGLGIIVNASILAAGFAIVLHQWRQASSNPCVKLWPVLIPFVAALIGIGSNMLLGRLGDAGLEHRLLVRIGLAVVIGGCFASTLCDWFDPVLTAPSCDPPVIYNAFYCTMFCLETIAQQVLSFPFTARVCITLSLAITVVCNGSMPLMSKALIGCSFALGEAVGYTLHRAARLQYQRERHYLERLTESEERVERLAGEKERVTFEVEHMSKLLRSTPRATGFASSSASNASNEEISSFLQQRTAAGDDVDVHELPRSVMERSQLHLPKRPIPSCKLAERQEALWRTLEESGLLAEDDPNRCSEASDLLGDWSPPAPHRRGLQ